MVTSGARPPDLSELVRVTDRLSFLYVEHTVISREDSAVTFSDADGTVHVPSAQLTCLLIGPGARITHHAIMLLADSGTSVVWVGQNAVRFYASGRGLSRSTRMLMAQAGLVSHERKRLTVARKMYEMRFPDESVVGLTMQQLRGKEGARIRACYRKHSERTGVPWLRRDYRPEDFFDSDPINMALSAANSALYGVVHAVVMALGCSPGLGFVHTGHERSFVHDVADLYKADLSIPLSFDVVASGVEDVAGHVRRVLRDEIAQSKLLSQCVRDLYSLLLPDEEVSDIDEEWAVVSGLWDGSGGVVAGGKDYSAEELGW